MARKRKQGAFEDWVDLVALSPWWVGVVLAIASYLWLHHVATAPVELVQGGRIGDALPQIVFRAFATAGQYLVPGICALGAIVSGWRRWERKRLIAEASNRSSALNEMSWQEFERLVGEAFRLGGYSVSETGGGGADGGVDLVLRKESEKYLVQCKQWRAYKVGVATVRELYGVMAASGATGGFVVTSGVFTQDAKDFTEGRNIELVDGAKLNEIIRRVRPQAHGAESKPSFTTQPNANPACPTCGSEMVRRTAKKGRQCG